MSTTEFKNNVKISGDLTMTGGITLPSTGATASPLNFYATGTHSTTWTGIWAADITIDITWTRIGNMVTLMSPAARATATTATFITNTGTFLPTYLRPTIAFIGHVSSATTTNQLGYMVLGTDGSLEVYKDVDFGNFPSSGGNTGFREWAISYIV